MARESKLTTQQQIAETEKEIDRLTQQRDDLNKKIADAKRKLVELQRRSKVESGDTLLTMLEQYGIDHLQLAEAAEKGGGAGLEAILSLVGKAKRNGIKPKEELAEPQGEPAAENGNEQSGDNNG